MSKHIEVKGYILQIWPGYNNVRSLKTISRDKRIIYKVSFDQLKNILKPSSSNDFKKDFDQPGLYIFAWWSKKKKDNKIYIGKSDTPLRNRLSYQKNQPKFKTVDEVFVLPLKDYYRYISYFERRLITEYQKYFKLENSQIKTNMFSADPETTDLSDSIISGFQRVENEIKELLSILSFQFEAIINKKFNKTKNIKKVFQSVDFDQTNNILRTFEVKKDRYHVWTRFESANHKKIYILKGSYTVCKVNINSNLVPRYQKDLQRILQIRAQLLNDKVLKQVGDKLIFKRDHLFKTPSIAGRIITGRSSNGYTDFKIPR